MKFNVIMLTTTAAATLYNMYGIIKWSVGEKRTHTHTRRQITFSVIDKRKFFFGILQKPYAIYARALLNPIAKYNNNNNKNLL